MAARWNAMGTFGSNRQTSLPNVMTTTALLFLATGCVVVPPEPNPYYQNNLVNPSRYRPSENPALPANDSDETGGIADTPPVETSAALDSPPARPPHLAGALLPSQLTAVRTQNRWRALLIGIDDYQNNDLYMDLTTAVSDVNALENILTTRYGFRPEDTMVLRNREATLVGIRAAFDNLYKACGKDDNVLIYYAGHGDLQANQAGFWLPADARSTYEVVTNAEIRDHVLRLPARRVLLVTDSCFSGSFLAQRNLGNKDIRAVVVRPKESMDISQQLTLDLHASREVLTSGGLAPVADQGLGHCAGHSPFACAVLTALRSAPRGSVLSATDLFVDVYRQMKETAAGQLPKHSIIQGEGGHAGGQFFFVRVGD